MDFFHNLNDYLCQEISIIGNDLLPLNFPSSRSSHHKRSYSIVIGDVINKMGLASARAQSLVTPITSALKYSNSSHLLYLMVNFKENDGRGTAIGYLKMGWKDLFIFDLEGTYLKRRCFCCLDFYIHDKKQRQGFGKKLYDFMLKDNGLSPGKIPIDRPSEKLVKFLQKHYNLQNIIPQSNNFIVYQQFFDKYNECNKKLPQNRFQGLGRFRCTPRSTIEDVMCNTSRDTDR